jgi:hypothetical protein
VVKPICYPNNNLDKIALAIIMYAVIGIGIVTLQTVTPVIAINGEELSSLRGGNGSLTTMTNESDTQKGMLETGMSAR